MGEIKNNYKIGKLYQGGYSSLEPEYGNLFTGYRASVGTLGVPTDPRTANLLKEVSDKLSAGVKTIEATMLSPEIVESIPKPHLKEIKRLSGLTGVDVTVHGPLVEASGVTDKGWSEGNRALAERQMLAAVEKAHEVNGDGKAPITFHSSAVLPADEYAKVIEKGKESEEITKMLIIDQDSGNVTQVKKEERYYPQFDEEKNILKKTHTPQDYVRITNESQWDKEVNDVITPLEHAGRIIQETEPIAIPTMQKIQHLNQQGYDLKDASKVNNVLSPKEIEFYNRYREGVSQLKDVQLHLQTLFDKAYKYSSDEEKRKLEKSVKLYSEQLGKEEDFRGQLNAMRQFRQQLEVVKPERFKPLNEFAMEHSQKTFGNVAYQSWKRYKNEAPIISIENPPAWMNAYGRAKDLKNLVEGAKDNMVKTLVTNDGVSESKAKKIADKMIGVSWDTNHINQLRRQGFTKKDIVKESKEIAPLVKHIHLSDGFGIDNAETPPGMGDSPIKEILEQMGERGVKMKKIIEAGNWWQHFKTSPVGPALEAMGSPLYSMKMGPYWNQVAGLEQGYFSGYGPTFPQINYETFGAGFSQLPSDLGGQRAGAKGSRLGGTPME